MPIRRRFKKTYAETDKPTVSPWGPVQTAITFGPGLWRVHTEGHGGILLSPERNADVPAYLRSNDCGYEEDIDWCIPTLVFSDEFCAVKKERYDEAKNCLLRNYPDDYEKFFSTTVEPGQSPKRDEREWRKTITHNYVATRAWDDTFPGVPEGCMVVEALLGDDRKLGEKKLIVMPAEDYAMPEKGLTPFGFVFARNHEYVEVDPTSFNPDGNVTKQEAPTSETRTVKVTLSLTYRTVGDVSGNPQDPPNKWDWADLLDLGSGESVEVIEVKDFFS